MGTSGLVVIKSDCDKNMFSGFLTRSRGYKTFFVLSSAETKIYPAHKC